MVKQKIIFGHTLNGSRSWVRRSNELSSSVSYQITNTNEIINKTISSKALKPLEEKNRLEGSDFWSGSCFSFKEPCLTSCKECLELTSLKEFCTYYGVTQLFWLKTSNSFRHFLVQIKICPTEPKRNSDLSISQCVWQGQIILLDMFTIYWMCSCSCFELDIVMLR